MVRIAEFDWGSEHYAAFCDLRQEFLRAPLGLDLFDEDLDAERDQRHFGIFDDGNLVGGAIIIERPDGTAQLRQMIVRPGHQGTGLGTQLIAEIESALRQASIGKLVLHARTGAVPFYERCGYRVVGDEFEHVSIPHRHMQKDL